MITPVLRCTLAISTLGLAVAASPAADAAIVNTAPFGGVPRTGALFPSTTGAGWHTCTAAVVASASRNTIITAAHCLTGTGSSFSFAPGYVSGSKPYGNWRVTRAYVDPRWKTSRNPLYDVAVLTLAKQSVGGRMRNIQDVTGAYTLHSQPSVGSVMQVPAYNAGWGDRPIRCTTTAYYAGVYPAFNCSNYNGGVSGAPFVQTVRGVNVVSGVIGGWHQGGCSPSTSYSSPFGAAETTLLNRAARGAAGDYLPYAGSDGC